MKSFFLFMCSVFLLFGIAFANSQSYEIEINLDIINPELNRDYNERVFSQNSLNRSVYLSILERVRESSDEELIKFYSGLIKLSQSRKFSPKNQQVLDVIEYMTVLKLISREHLNKSYIDSQNMWEIYKNKELGIELVYRKNHWNGNERKIITKENLLHIPGEKETTNDVIESFNTKTNYELLRRTKNVFLVENDVKNNEKIADILEKTYGKGCRSFEEYPTKNKDVVRIYIYKKESQKNGCEHYVMDSAEYNKRLQKLILWNLGSSFCYFKTEAECGLFYRSNKFVEDK